MATIYCNEPLAFDSERIWCAQNGATRRQLVIVNKLGENSPKEPAYNFRADIGFLTKGNHAFIFLNKEKNPNDTRVFGMFVNANYGYELVAGDEIFAASSVGGYGNAESKFGIYKIGTLIKVHTYKNRRPPQYYRLTASGWENVPAEEILQSEQTIL